MVMLVALRVVIGWHFFKEGMSHRADPNWTSEGFLKQAKGPLAGNYQAVLPKFHDWDRLILAPLADGGDAAGDEAAEDAPPAKSDQTKNENSKSDKDKTAKPPPIYDEWLKEVAKDWKAEQEAFATFYNFDIKQRDQAAEILKQSAKQMDDVMKGNADDVRLYRQLVYRTQKMQTTPGSDQIPFIKNRAATVKKDPLGEAGLSGTSAVLGSPPPAWQADAKGIEKLYHDRLDELLTAEQRQLGAPDPETAKLHKIDTVVTWVILIAGGCLIVGLFTRLAALAGAAFLLSIVCTQPPWLADSIQTQTYYQWVELLALLALATTAVGRWGGLDYFIHLLVRPCCAAKGKKA